MTNHPAAGSAARNQYGTFKVHHPSPAQLRFVASLVARKGTGDADGSFYQDFREGRMNKKQASKYIDQLLALPDLEAKPEPVADEVDHSGPASDKQLGFLRSLIRDRDVYPGVEAEAALSALEDAVAAGRMTKKHTSRVIDRALTCPKRNKPAAREVEVGMYRDGDAIYRVYLGQQSGRNLVKRVVGSKDEGYSYEYVGLAATKLPATATPLSLDEAKAWGRMTGHCCVCGLRLDNPESVEAGIGPVCASKF